LGKPSGRQVLAPPARNENPPARIEPPRTQARSPGRSPLASQSQSPEAARHLQIKAPPENGEYPPRSRAIRAIHTDRAGRQAQRAARGPAHEGKGKPQLPREGGRAPSSAGNPLDGYALRSRHGATLLLSCPAWLECRLEEAVEKGDHSVFIGQVTAAGVRSQPDGRPDEATLWLKDLGNNVFYGGRSRRAKKGAAQSHPPELPPRPAYSQPGPLTCAGATSVGSSDDAKPSGSARKPSTSARS